ncbi:MAG: site-specific DNA-methyltransferase [Synergistaceae bacterium]|jgi:hypothetical protein|nr:site-specific DNA-methyltransferase [Synergistaceae bacterium]
MSLLSEKGEELAALSLYGHLPQKDEGDAERRIRLCRPSSREIAGGYNGNRDFGQFLITQDWLWYWPPGEMVEKMAEYAAKNGERTDRPYFSLDGKRSMTAKEWDSLRYEWNHVHGLTNVWREDPLHGNERFRGGYFKSAPRSSARTRAAAFHLNQKPLEFMRRLITATTNTGGVIWEPFGGLASASVAAIKLGRYACTAEINEKFQGATQDRLLKEAAKHAPLLKLIV